jgi:hypothetical protein
VGGMGGIKIHSDRDIAYRMKTINTFGGEPM